ncbi:MAG TPA: hypothetical protein DEP23_12095 [Ruminococcaceae bacterium]|nr:hypothetical protein [Oscillospiraceae bacterium]
MDPKDKQRVSVYLDKELVRQADNLQSILGCKSRNALYSLALENMIADETIKEHGDVLIKKLANAIEKAVDLHTIKISKGMFRYAVEMEIILQMFALYLKFPPEQVQSMRREAINNVRRTRGKVRLDDLFTRKDTDSL